MLWRTKGVVLLSSRPESRTHIPNISKQGKLNTPFALLPRFHRRYTVAREIPKRQLTV